MTYGYIGSMKTKTGRRDEVVSILLSGVGGLREAGCQLYIVSVSDADDNTIWVTEVWQSNEHHDASLQLVSVVFRLLVTCHGPQTAQQRSTLRLVAAHKEGFAPSRRRGLGSSQTVPVVVRLHPVGLPVRRGHVSFSWTEGP
jgi:quinol monooxygenase YgiN